MTTARRFILCTSFCLVLSGGSSARAQSYVDLSEPMKGSSQWALETDGTPVPLGVVRVAKRPSEEPAPPVVGYAGVPARAEDAPAETRRNPRRAGSRQVSVAVYSFESGRSEQRDTQARPTQSSKPAPRPRSRIRFGRRR